MSAFRTIVADPPWRVQTGPAGSSVGEGWVGHDGRSRPVGFPTMTVAEIVALPVADLADDDAHLYLWTINRYVEDAYEVARAWGFKPSTLLVWAKTPMGSGLGGAFGICTEYILFARRGSLAPLSKVNRTWFDWPRFHKANNGKPAHSAKPDAALDLIEQVSPGPYLELFARRARLGWEYAGNESLSTIELPGLAA